MRALVVEEFGAPDKLVPRDLPAPQPGPGEVRVDIKAIGVNFPDLLVIGGTYQLLPDRPFVPGKEFAGIVSEVGPGVRAFRAGDRVRAPVEWGAFQEQLSVRADLCHLIPDGMTFEEAAAFNVTYLTAYYALVRRARLQAGETVLVTAAAGGVGTAGVQVAKALGARVIGYVGSPAKRTIVAAAGADHVIDASQGQLRDLVRDLTDSRGADVVLEMVGGDIFEQCLRSTAWEGRLVTIGFASGELPSARAGYLLVKNIAVLGLQVTDYRDRDVQDWQAAMDALDDLYRRGLVKPAVTASFPLDRAAEALAVVQRGEVTGKIVLTT